MRIYLHDYAGHPFQVQLSRALAARGHVVRHGYSSTNVTPHGRLEREPDDPEGFEPDPIDAGSTVDKTRTSLGGMLRRRRHERAYGEALARHVEAFKPDVVIAANTPLDAIKPLQDWCLDAGIPFVNWLQDVISLATSKLLRRRIPVVGGVIGAWYQWVERRVLRRSDTVVVITDDFRPLLRRWGIPMERVKTIENWAPIDEIPLRPQANAWSREHGLDGLRVFLYAGTLGMKHNPRLLMDLARHFRDDPTVRVVVIAEGAGAEWLATHSAAEEPDLTTLVLLPFQSFERMPDVLASASVLLAILEPDAGIYSVPSKVLTSLCAGRALLLAVPLENLAARVVKHADAGLVVGPTDSDRFIAAAEELLADDGLRERAGKSAREYAELAFDIGRITDRFEAIQEKK